MANNTNTADDTTTHECGLSPKPVPGPMPLRETFDTNTPHECGLSAQAIAWVQEHGSEFLQFCVAVSAERVLCRYLYNVERAKLEASGWSLLDEDTYQPDHPPAGAMELFSRGRERFPQAELRVFHCDDCVEFVVVADAPWPDGGKLVFDETFIVDF